MSPSYSIIYQSDKGAQFTLDLEVILRGLGTKVKLSITFHPQTDGKVERTIQTLEDMVRACIIYFKENWDNNFPLVAFYIIIVFIHPYQWILMKASMVGGVGLLFDGLKLVISSCSQFYLLYIGEGSYHKEPVANFL